jgi:hypothetical protein
MDFKQDIKITEIKVVNPYLQKEMPVSNKELLYTYKKLSEYENLIPEGEVDKFKTGRYALLSEIGKLQEEFVHIMNNPHYSNAESFQ